MGWGPITESHALWWVSAALALGIAELVVPGVFLVFLAIAAAAVAIMALVLPDLGLTGELVAFAAWSAVAVLVGRRWYGQYPVATDDPHLNDRAARLVGQEVRVIQAIADGRGRVRIGDGEWPAAGADTVAGARVRIVRVDGGLVHVAPIASQSDDGATRREG